MNKKFYLKWMKIILFVEEYTAKEISMLTNTTSAVVFKMLHFFKEKEWITIQKKGRNNIIFYTKKGKKIKEHCYEILKELDELKSDNKFNNINIGDLYEKI